MSRAVPALNLRLILLALGALLTAGLLLQATPAYAATFTVTTVLDENDGACDAQGTGCSLREAVIAANGNAEADTITLPFGLFPLTITGAGDDTAATGDLDITSQITIVGNGSTIDAAALGDRIFDIRGGDLTIGAIDLQNGTANASPDDRGGAIRVDADGTLDIDTGTIQGNSAPLAGGGIENTGGTVTATDVLFIQNTATGVPAAGNGGAIHAAGPSAVTTVVGGTVTGNDAVEGGGFWNAAGTFIVDGVILQLNDASGDLAVQGGGALWNEAAGTMTVTASTFFDNNATGLAGSGGAIFNTDAGSVVTVDGSSFEGNDSNRAGGAIENTAAGTVEVTDSDFTSNIAGMSPGNGGAIHNGGGDVSVTGGTATGNTATEGGGFWAGDGTFAVDGVEFDANVALGTAADNGGGAFYNNGGGTVSITGATFSANTATAGAGSGGAILTTDAMTIADSTFTGNSAARAGGAIEIIGGPVDISGTDFDGNDVAAIANPGNGGAIHQGAGDVSVSGGTVSNNTATEGSGFWAQAGAFTVDGTAFDSNAALGTAADNGGAFYNNGGGTVSITGATFSANTATAGSGSGGAILTTDAMTIAGSTFSGNLANRAGGAIEIIGGPVDISESVFNTNDVADGAAPGNGGAIHNGGQDVTVTGGSATGNTAIEGGAFWNTGGTFTVDSVVFDSNDAAGTEATQGGGALYNEGAGTLDVSDSVLTGNTATTGSGSGGAILNVEADSTLIVDGSTFTGNAANRAGGAIEVAAGSQATATFSDFDANDVAQGAAPGNGGAIHNGAGTVSVTGGTTSDNTAIEGGGFWNSGGTFAVTGVAFDGNVASGSEASQGGGALYNEGAGAMTVDGSQFTSNAANVGSGSGGAILNINVEGQTGDSVLDVVNSRFEANAANRAGGAIENAGAVATIQFADFMRNDVALVAAPGNGGAIHDGGGTITVSDSTASGNTAVEGGAFWVSGTMTVTDTTITGNTAESGGALYIEEGGTLILDGVSADGNDATAGDGNALFNNGGTDTATDTTLFSGDPATGATCNQLVAGDNGGNLDDDGSCFDVELIVDRVQGADRIQTAIAASQAAFGDGEADAVVLTRADIYPDALAGTPLAVQENAPLLLTGQAGLDTNVDTEIQRVLGDDGTVYLLGGTAALDETVQNDVETLGFEVVRLGGVNRFDTAVVIARDGLDNPDLTLLADGEGFADAVSAGAAAAANGGAVLLTNDDVLPPETAAYLDTSSDTDAGTDTSSDTFAIGGPAARAVPSATPVFGLNRVDTSVLVATTFFTSPPIAGIATEGAFPDALAGGVLVAAEGGPLLLSSTDMLSASVADYLGDNSGSINRVVLFGGTNALASAVEDGVREQFRTMAP